MLYISKTDFPELKRKLEDRKTPFYKKRSLLRRIKSEKIIKRIILEVNDPEIAKYAISHVCLKDKSFLRQVFQNMSNPSIKRVAKKRLQEK